MSGAHGHVDHGNKGIALLISVLALVLALSETLGKSYQVAGLAAHIEAANLWAFYQAKTIRYTTMRTAAEQLQAQAGGSTTEEMKKQIDKRWKAADRHNLNRDRRAAEPPSAKVAEQKRDKSLAAYHHFEVASAAVQIAIVMASASIITSIPARLGRRRLARSASRS
jgi:hypothetical protein